MNLTQIDFFELYFYLALLGLFIQIMGGIHANKTTILIYTSIGLISMVGCAGTGRVEIDGPLSKLDEASYLYREKNEFILAENLIWKAIESARIQQDFFASAKAYKIYSEFLDSRSIEQWKSFYDKNGFYDQSVTLYNLKEKSEEYLKIAIIIYGHTEEDFISKKSFKKLANVYLDMANVFQKNGDIEAACAYWDSAIQAYQKHMLLDSKFNSYNVENYTKRIKCIEEMKRQNGCL